MSTRIREFFFSENSSLIPFERYPEENSNNSTLTIQEIPTPTVYRIVEQPLRSPHHFFKDLSF